MLKKERLNDDELVTFTASNDWLERFKLTYDLLGETYDVPRETIQSRIECLPELASGCRLRDIST